MGLHDTRVPCSCRVVVNLCLAINNTQSVPYTAVTSPAVVHCFCARPGNESVQQWSTPWESTRWLHHPNGLLFHVFVCEIQTYVVAVQCMDVFTPIPYCLLLLTHRCSMSTGATGATPSPHHQSSTVTAPFIPQQLLPAGTMCISCTLSMEH